MTRYSNLSGTSGVRAYQLETTAILVEFKDRTQYRYSYASAGVANVEHMKRLAEAGRGLATFIRQSAYGLYER